MVDVVVTQHDRIEVAIDQALRGLSLDDLVRGRLVAVKPNDTWASTDDTTAVTQGDTLRAVIQHLKRLRPRHLVVSGGAGAAETADVFRLAGMIDAVDAEGVEFFDHNRPPFQTVALDYAPDLGVSSPQREVVVNPRVLEYETVVSLAQLKVHRAATVTLTLKNVALSFPAADYYGHARESKLHDHAIFADLHAFIAAMVRRFPIHLGVIVGHPAMIGTGPVGGTTFETGLVIASRDPVAADAVGARVLGVNARAVGHLVKAEALGLGTTDPGKMRFPALTVDEAVRAFQQAAQRHGKWPI